MKQQTLRQQFKAIYRFFKKKTISKHSKIKLNSLPWILVIGQVESGKTTLLTHVEKHYIFSKKTEQHHANIPQWSCTKKASFIDIPGNYLLDETQTQWQQCIKLIKRYQKPAILGGIIIVLDIHDLMHRSMHSIKHRLSQIQASVSALHHEHKKTLPIHIILNKTDLIPGFCEFFEEQSLEEKQQTWGFLLSNEIAADKLSKTLAQEFNLLIKQLNQQMTKRLQHTYNEEQKNLIKGFPLHIEKLKKALSRPLADFITNINQLKPYCVNGIYFTSTQQHAQLHAPQDTNDTGAHHKNYFTKQTIEHIVALSSHQPRSTNNLNQFISLLFCAAIIISTIFYCSHRFSEHMAAISNTESVINTYQTMQQQGTPLSLNQSQLLLAQLHNAKLMLADESENRIIGKLLFDNNPAIIKQAETTYNDIINHAFLPALALWLENIMLEHTNQPEQQYMALTYYLMLGGAISPDAAYLESHLASLVENSEPFNITQMTQLQAFMRDAISNNFNAISINKQIITTTRKQLNDLPASDIAYILLYANTGGVQSIHINDILPDAIFSVPAQYSTIPSVYTKQEFQRIYPALLNTIATQVQNGNGILGVRTPLPDMNEQELTKQLKQFYLSEYINTWQETLNHIQLTPCKNWSSLRQQLTSLSSPQSPILYLLKTVQDNTQLKGLKNASLASLNNLLTNLTTPDKSLLFSTFKAMEKFSETSKAMTENTQASFDLAKAYAQGNVQALPEGFSQLKHLTGELPAPLSAWISQLLTESWSLLLHDTADYINIQWKQQILQPYNSNIKDFYPFNNAAKNDVSLSDFSHFFGYDGLIDQFEKNYIFPFVNLSSNEWYSKPEFSSILNLPTNVSSQLQRYLIIQQMYFEQSNAQTHIEFTLNPESVSNNVRKFDLVIGKQNILYNTKTPNPPVTLVWPTPEKDQTVSLVFTNLEGKRFTKIFNSTWAWSKAVNQYAQHGNTLDASNISLSFDTGFGMSAQYILTTHGQYNPFDVDFLQKTWMPQWVFQQ